MPFVVYIKCTQYLTHLHRALKKRNRYLQSKFPKLELSLAAPSAVMKLMWISRQRTLNEGSFIDQCSSSAVIPVSSFTARPTPNQRCSKCFHLLSINSLQATQGQHSYFNNQLASNLYQLSNVNTSVMLLQCLKLTHARQSVSISLQTGRNKNKSSERQCQSQRRSQHCFRRSQYLDFLHP